MNQDKLYDSRPPPTIFIHSELDDYQLTPQEFRVYAHLSRRAGIKNTAWPSIAGMSDVCKIGKRQIIESIKALEAINMIRAERKLGEKTVYFLTAKSDWIEMTDEIRASCRYDGPEDVPIPHGNQFPTGTGTHSPREHEGNPLEGNPKIDISEMVLKIYKDYPKKVGKNFALKAIRRAVLVEGGEKIQRLTADYARAVSLWPEADHKFIPHPATWYNQGRYDDDQTTWSRQPSPSLMKLSTQSRDDIIRQLENVGPSVANDPAETQRRKDLRASLMKKLEQLDANG